MRTRVIVAFGRSAAASAGRSKPTAGAAARALSRVRRFTIVPPDLWRCRRPEELRRRERLAREARQMNGALEIKHFVDPHADRGVPLAVRGEIQFGRALANTVD